MKKPGQEHTGLFELRCALTWWESGEGVSHGSALNPEAMVFMGLGLRTVLREIEPREHLADFILRAYRQGPQ